MPESYSILTVISLLACLQIKHMFADFFLQTPYMLGAGTTYAHGGRALHCGVHAVGTGICFALVGAPALVLAVVLIAAEWVVHFHIDWGKAVWTHRRNQDTSHAGYWRAFGFDQMLHQMTYLAMIWIMIA